MEQSEAAKQSFETIKSLPENGPFRSLAMPVRLHQALHYTCQALHCLMKSSCEALMKNSNSRLAKLHVFHMACISPSSKQDGKASHDRQHAKDTGLPEVQHTECLQVSARTFAIDRAGATHII